MTGAASGMPAGVRMRLPATSANLGSGFDSAAVALDFYLELEAHPAAEFSIDAAGRDAERCSKIEDNLILGIYQRILRESNRPVLPLSIKMRNSIPLGMGCGSSAAGRLAAIWLAVHFGRLGWSQEKILEEACTLEGHPDNAAACLLGGFVAAATREKTVYVARAVPSAEWRVIVVLPPDPLPTSKARAVLPATYSREDAVANIQSASLLGLAFAKGDGKLLRVAMQDRIHQPYRSAICPLLPRLLPLSGSDGILGAALSGAGPSVLVIVENEAAISRASAAIRAAVADFPAPELIECRFSCEGAILTGEPAAV